MKWILSPLLVTLVVYKVNGQASLGPLQSGPGTNGPTTSMGMMRPAYPPIFENVLTEGQKDQLREIQANRDLSWEERREQADAILDQIPPAELSKLPLPPAFEKLPNGVYEQIKQIHEDTEMKWSERRQKVRQIMQTVPHDQRRAAFKDSWFPPVPPPGFEAVLAPTVYQQLIAVHQNTKLSVVEKKQQVDKVMQQVPADQLAKLPLPPLMRQLPAETQQRIRSIMHNYKTPWNERHAKVREFVKSLPVEERRLMRPPLPPFVRDLPQEAQQKLQAIHDNDELEPRERMQQFREVMESLPEEIRQQIQQQQRNGPMQN